MQHNNNNNKNRDNVLEDVLDVVGKNKMSLVKLFSFALFFRLFVLLFAILSNVFLNDHMAEGVHIYCHRCDSHKQCVHAFVDSFSKWDSAYFLDISRFGYIKQQFVAFFPMFPFLISCLTSLLCDNFHVDDDIARVIAGLMISNISFLIAFIVLYQLLTIIEPDERTKRIAIALFVVNPATIFFSSVYSESFFALCSWLGMLLMLKNRPIWASICWFCASLTRSNGSFLSAFVASISLIRLKIFFTTKNYSKFLQAFVRWMWLSLMVGAPLLLWDCFVRHYACLTFVDGDDMHINVSDDPMTSQCACSMELVHSASVYAFVQEKYWGVGFLRYFQLKQIPNFLLALPIQVLAVKSIRRNITSANTICCGGDLTVAHIVIAMRIHCLLLLVMGTMFAHVQICTRLILSSSPIVYLTMADMVMEANVSRKYLFLAYIIVFAFVGTALHVNFYPWT